MGNCLVYKEKVIRIVKPDGKILEYKAPIKVQQVLSDFADHALSDSLETSHHLRPGTKLLSGHIYHLVPLPPQTPKIKKKVRFSVPEKQDFPGAGAVRIKLIVSKQELIEMLRNGGSSADGMISTLRPQYQQSFNKVDLR